MNLQYITDDKGNTTGVYIPIQEWNDLKSKYKDIGQDDFEVPEWHMKIVNERMEEYRKNSEQGDDFDSTLDEIEKAL